MRIADDSAPGHPRHFRLARHAFQWWCAELAGLYHDLARHVGRDARNAVIIEAGERTWIARQRERVLVEIDRGDDETARRAALATFVLAARKRGRLVVEIPAERVLAKRIMLPAMAEGAIERVLGFEIGRHFPFPAERVHFRHRVAGRRGDGAIEIELVAVPRELVASIVAELAEAGLRPAEIILAGAGAPLGLGAATLGRSSKFRPVERALALLLVATAVAALAAPILADALRLAATERAIAALAPSLDRVRAAQDRARRDEAALAAPLGLKDARPPLVAVLAALTKAVPDGSWLTALGINGDEVDLDGLSPSAATLALSLAKSGGFSDVTFRSTISRDPTTGLEHFRLSATIAAEKP